MLRDTSDKACSYYIPTLSYACYAVTGLSTTWQELHTIRRTAEINSSTYKSLLWPIPDYQHMCSNVQRSQLLQLSSMTFYTPSDSGIVVKWVVGLWFDDSTQGFYLPVSVVNAFLTEVYSDLTNKSVLAPIIVLPFIFNSYELKDVTTRLNR